MNSEKYDRRDSGNHKGKSDGEIPRACYKVSSENPAGKISEQKQAQIHTQQELHPRPLEGIVTNIHTVASGRKSNTTTELQNGEEKHFPST